MELHSKNKLFGISYNKGQRQDKSISILKLPHCKVTDAIEKAEKRMCISNQFLQLKT